MNEYIIVHIYPWKYSLEQFKIYSDPKRDQRRHTVSAVFRCIAIDSNRLKKGIYAYRHKFMYMNLFRDMLTYIYICIYINAAYMHVCDSNLIKYIYIYICTDINMYSYILNIPIYTQVVMSRISSSSLWRISWNYFSICA
jgi:uncharacterized membrane protein YesL